MFATTNVDLKTGYRYGAVTFNALNQELLNEVCMKGIDLFYTIYSKELRKKKKEVLAEIKSILTDVGGFSSKKLGELCIPFEYGTFELSEHTWGEWWLGLQGKWPTLKDVDYLIDIYLEGLEINDDAIDGVVIVHEKTSVMYCTSLCCLLVIKSDYRADCRLCSPCLPNAADLDNPGVFPAYAPPPDWVDPERFDATRIKKRLPRKINLRFPYDQLAE